MGSEKRVSSLGSVTLTNKFAPDIRAPEHLGQLWTDLEAEGEPLGRVGDAGAPVAMMGRASGQEITKETADWNGTRGPVKFPPAEELAFFSSARGRFPRKDQLLLKKS